MIQRFFPIGRPICRPCSRRIIAAFGAFGYFQTILNPRLQLGGVGLPSHSFTGLGFGFVIFVTAAVVARAVAAAAFSPVARAFDGTGLRLFL